MINTERIITPSITPSKRLKVLPKLVGKPEKMLEVSRFDYVFKLVKRETVEPRDMKPEVSDGKLAIRPDDIYYYTVCLEFYLLETLLTLVKDVRFNIEGLQVEKKVYSDLKKEAVEMERIVTSSRSRFLEFRHGEVGKFMSAFQDLADDEFLEELWSGRQMIIDKMHKSKQSKCEDIATLILADTIGRLQRVVVNNICAIPALKKFGKYLDNIWTMIPDVEKQFKKIMDIYNTVFNSDGVKINLNSKKLGVLDHYKNIANKMLDIKVMIPKYFKSLGYNI